MENAEEVELFKGILNQFTLIRENALKEFTKDLQKILASSSLIKATAKEENRKTSFLFNPLFFFNIGETMHSFLLSHLLDPEGSHGQGNLFLKLFLNKYDIDFDDSDQWTVTAETGRIDILLKRKHPKAVIIIENKSNYAVDQDCQLYRYWFKEMFLPEQDAMVLKDRKHFRIFYLSPDINKIPEPYSLKKPEDESYKAFPSLPDKLDESDIEKIFFGQDIVEWLNDCLKEIENENHRLREYITQYIEIWKP